MSVMAPEAPAPDIEEFDLRVADRCDAGSCGAQAHVVTMHHAGPLMWCAHHAAKYNVAEYGQIVADTRDTLTKRETGDHA